MSTRKNHWVQSGWGIEVRSVDQLVRLVGRVGTLERGQKFVWRGVADASWQILSSLQVAIKRGDFAKAKLHSNPNDQDDLRQVERRILDGAHHWGIGVTEGGVMPDLQLLAMLQHHGAPTRLIDVTTDPMTALWFACQPPASLRGSPVDEGGRESGRRRSPKHALFAFNVTSVANVTTVEPMGGLTSSFADQAAASLDVALTHSRDTGNPVLLTPRVQDVRMAAQRGRFLLGVESTSPVVPGLHAFPFEAGSPPGEEGLTRLMAPEEKGKGRPRRIDFLAIIFNDGIREKILDHLRASYDTSASTMYPDLQGYVEALKFDAFDLDKVPARGQLDQLIFNPEAPAATAELADDDS